MSEGGCLCGAVRYRLDSAPFDAGYCHCRICQLASGAPVMAFATVAREGFTLITGDPVRYASSDFGERWFCGRCGTQLAMLVSHQPATIDFTIATLDSPNDLRPTFHIWTHSRISWFDTSDACARHERFRVDTVGLTADVANGAPVSATAKTRSRSNER